MLCPPNSKNVENNYLFIVKKMNALRKHKENIILLHNLFFMAKINLQKCEILQPNFTLGFYRKAYLTIKKMIKVSLRIKEKRFKS